MNKKELIKLLDKYEIEYEITDNTKKVEEGLRLFDEALKKIGIIIPKETQVDTITKENDLEVPKYTTEWASSDDLISRQAAIQAMAPFDTNHELRDTLEGLPTVEPPKKVVAQIKVDTDELMERIKEEYEIKDLPVCEDAISRQDAIKAVEAKIKWFDGDAIEDRCKRYAFMQVLDEILTELPPVEPTHKAICEHFYKGYCSRFEDGCFWQCQKEQERPKGEWIFNPKDAIDLMFTRPKCNKCGFESADGGNFCSNCGADMRGKK